MTLEVTTTIAGLDSTAPLSGDGVFEGDNHLRLIKGVLKNIFKGSGGNGFSIPITATEAEINYLAGVTSAIQTQLNSLATAKFSVGTRVVFAQATAPTHWTKITTWSNHMLRVVSDGSGGSSGGMDSPILMDKVPSHTHVVNPASVLTSSSGAHSHTYLDYGMNMPGTGDHGSGGQGGFRGGTTDSVASHQHSVDIPSTATAVNIGADIWQPMYLNLIVCEFTG